MTIAVGDRLPEAIFLENGVEGIAPVTGDALFGGRRVVLFAVPGAYTGVCSTRHVPSFIRVADALRAKGVDEIVCVAVNDPFVMKAWGEATGATNAGIRMLSDPEGTFARAIGLIFDNPARGLIGRSRRYALLAEDGVVRVLNVEASTGECELSAGETMLAAL
jgi:cytochrome c peroxidase